MVRTPCRVFLSARLRCSGALLLTSSALQVPCLGTRLPRQTLGKEHCATFAFQMCNSSAQTHCMQASMRSHQRVLKPGPALQARRLQRKMAEGGDLGLDDGGAPPPARATLQKLQAPKGRRRGAGGNPDPAPRAAQGADAARHKRKADAGAPFGKENGAGALPYMLTCATAWLLSYWLPVPAYRQQYRHA